MVQADRRGFDESCGRVCLVLKVVFPSVEILNQLLGVVLGVMDHVDSGLAEAPDSVSFEVAEPAVHMVD